jgi:3-phosphoshikimate 1-carboxyvinyltransferase
MKEVKKAGKAAAVFRLPGSKSHTQRALIAASLAEGESFLRNPLLSEDTELLIGALRKLGAEIMVSSGDFIVRGTGGRCRSPGRPVFVGNNGTALRFLAAVSSLSEGTVILDGSDRLRERPVGPLLGMLRSQGIATRCLREEGYPPVEITGGTLRGGTVSLDRMDSSQYVSAMLLAAPYARRDLEVVLPGRTVSLPYVDMTLETMERFGIAGIRREGGRCLVPAPQGYGGRKVLIDGDASTASYFFLAAAIGKGKAVVENWNPRTAQGDRAFPALLAALGCLVEEGEHSAAVTGGDLKEGDLSFDMGAMPDLVPTLAVLSAFRNGKTEIGNVAHLRIKESNRILALVTELGKIGVAAEERPDGLVVHGGTPRGAEIETYGDHRIAMSFAVAGLVTGGMKIRNPGCVGKSFPRFWEELEKWA